MKTESPHVAERHRQSTSRMHCLAKRRMCNPWRFSWRRTIRCEHRDTGQHFRRGGLRDGNCREWQARAFEMRRIAGGVFVSRAHGHANARDATAMRRSARPCRRPSAARCHSGGEDIRLHRFDVCGGQGSRLGGRYGRLFGQAAQRTRHAAEVERAGKGGPSWVRRRRLAEHHQPSQRPEAVRSCGNDGIWNCGADRMSGEYADEFASPVRLLVKVPRTGHDVVFDDSINEVSQVITAISRARPSRAAEPAGEECEGAGDRAEPVRQRHCRRLRHGQGGQSFSTAITSTYQPIFIPAAWFHWTTS